MKTLSLDLRERILALYDEGQGTRQEIADRFLVSLGMVKKLIAQRKRTGDIAARHSFAGRKPKITQEHREQMTELISRQSDLTLREIRENLGLCCSLSAIHYILKDMKMTFKKKLFAPVNRDVRMLKRQGKTGSVKLKILISGIWFS